MADAWTWTDGWILGSLIMARGSEHPDLAGVIGLADYINRLVLSREDIVSTLNRLREAGLVDPDDPLIPTASAVSLWERAQRGTTIDRIHDLVDHMNREAQERTSLNAWSLTEADYRASFDLYQQRFAEALARLRPGG